MNFLFRHKIFVILLIISVITLLFIATNTDEPIFSNLNKTSTIIPKVHAITNQESTTDYKLDIKYPQLITQQNNNPDFNSINNDIKKFVDDELNDFKLGWRECNSNTGECFYTSANNSKFSDVQNTFYLSYEIVSLSESIYSLELHTSKWFREGNAPDNQIFTYNYDFKKNKVINFTDLIVTPKIIEKLSPIALERLKNKYKENISGFDGGLKDLQLKEDTKFLLNKDGIEILFSQYEIADRPTGEPRVVIPYREIKDLLSPDYIFLSKH